MRPILVTAALLAAGLAGCASPEPLTPPDATTQHSSNQDPTREAVPGGAMLEYTGKLKADACTVSEHANTCNHHARDASSPPPHVSWHEIKLDAADQLRIEADWSWQESGQATFYVWLTCDDRSHEPCMTADGTLARETSSQPIISTRDLDIQAFEANHRLWMYFGVEPESIAAGEHYPRVNVDYTIKVQIEDAP